jgi:dihydroflavonol-4-reductase
MQQRALVTGGGGFIAGHLIEQLLAAGDVVHATVRDLAAIAKVQHLLDLQRSHPGQLHLFEADLLRPGSFNAAMKDCEVVYHVASPFLMPEQIKDPRTQLIEPALAGTRNVLASVEATPSVRRLVLTSTVGAIFGDYIDVMEMEGQVCSERYFNTTSSADYNQYHYSKVVSEQEAWRLCQAQARWDMVTINPGLVLGPSLSGGSDSGSLFLLDEMLKGQFWYGVPNLYFTTVDVREVAQAHVAAAKLPTARGRYVLCDKEMTSFLEMARIFRQVHPRPRALPRWELPTGVMRIVGPLFHLSGKFMRNHFGIRFRSDNQRSIDELGVRYRPLRETLIDHYRSWAAKTAS